ncbi:MAG: sensor histidine kinase [Lachnospiraceae bacterium]|nr:sensor histidine kinase [Lachnospiraceae bacterium]
MRHQKKEKFGSIRLLQIKRDVFFRKILFINLIFTCTVVMFAMSCAVYQSIQIADQNITSVISSVSYMIANDSEVKEALSAGSKMKPEVQKKLDQITEDTEYIDIITVADQNSIRLYHPQKDSIGKKFSGGDERRFTKEKTAYVTTAKGTLGKQRRAFTQVLDKEGAPVGFVMVSSLVSNIYDQYLSVLVTFIPMTLAILLGAVLLSGFIAYEIRKSLLGHNPSEFVRLFLQKKEIFDALEEGILAIDKEGIIFFVNRAGAQIYHQEPENLQGRPIAEVIPSCRLGRVLQSKEAEYNREIRIFEENILCDRIPMYEKGVITGALCIYRNKTEMTKLAEELTGVKHIMEALRSNMHEFKNHLHIILGMIQLGESNLAEQYISDLNMDSMMLSTVVKCIENKTLAALVYGKIGQAREQGITMSIEQGSYLPVRNSYLSTNQLVTILGNLLQNAIDATAGKETAAEIVLFVSCDEKHLKIAVDDTGCGILPENMDKICNRGFSTKGTDRGIGMNLVRGIVQDHGGTLIFDSEPGEGTSVVVEMRS